MMIAFRCANKEVWGNEHMLNHTFFEMHYISFEKIWPSLTFPKSTHPLIFWKKKIRSFDGCRTNIDRGRSNTPLFRPRFHGAVHSDSSSHFSFFQFRFSFVSSLHSPSRFGFSSSSSICCSSSCFPFPSSVLTFFSLHWPELVFPVKYIYCSWLVFSVNKHFRNDFSKMLFSSKSCKIWHLPLLFYVFFFGMECSSSRFGNTNSKHISQLSYNLNFAISKHLHELHHPLPTLVASKHHHELHYHLPE